MELGADVVWLCKDEIAFATFCGDALYPILHPVIAYALLTPFITIVRSFMPSYAAMDGGFPTGLITPFFLPKEQQKANFFWGYLIDSIAMAVILVELYFMLNYGNLSGEVISSIALVSWAVLAVALVFINQKYNK